MTGVSSGIGLASAKRLLNEGYTVFGLSRRRCVLDHPNFHHSVVDLSELKSLHDRLAPFTGVDTLICNVGKGLFGNLEELSYEQILSLINLNFLSHVYLVKRLLPYLKQKERSDIVFIGSEASLAGKRQGSIYCASKFALRGFAQSLRDECSRSSVHVSLVQPGMVRTPFYKALTFHPGAEESHALLPEDVAEVICSILKMRKEVVCDEIILSPMKRVIQKRRPSE